MTEPRQPRRKSGGRIPRPAFDGSSGRGRMPFSVRILPSLRAKLQAEADEVGVCLAEQIEKVLEEHFLLNQMRDIIREEIRNELRSVPNIVKLKSVA